MSEIAWSERVSYRVHGRTAVITLDREHVRNAVDSLMASALEGALDQAEGDDDVWVVVLTGAGEVFCAGADLRAIASGEIDGIDTPRGGFAGLVRRRRVKPLIAAVNGPALAGGFEIVLACDLVVAAETASFALPEVKRSLMAVAGGLLRLPRAIPRNIAMEMVLTGDPIDAQRAAVLGLVNVVCERDRVLDEALALAERVAVNAPLAVQASRRVIVDCAQLDENTAWLMGEQAVDALATTADFLEGPRAFVEKRAPAWTARRGQSRTP